MIDITETIISQYRHSPTIIKLISAFNQQVDPARQIDEFRSEIWDLRSCGTYGLDIWGVILGGVPRIYTGDDGVTKVLDDEEYRSLLFLRAAANITDCSMPDLNRILQELFKNRGVPYVIKAATKYLRYVFSFALEPWEKTLLRTAGIMPRPAAVEFEIFEYDPDYTFGFYVEGVPPESQPWKPFNHGTFGDVYYEF